jgi:hypothetical protein
VNWLPKNKMKILTFRKAVQPAVRFPYPGASKLRWIITSAASARNRLYEGKPSSQAWRLAIDTAKKQGVTLMLMEQDRQYVLVTLSVLTNGAVLVNNIDHTQWSLYHAVEGIRTWSNYYWQRYGLPKEANYGI